MKNVKNMHRRKKNSKQSARRRIVVRVGAVHLVYRMWGAVISEEKIKMVAVKNTLEWFQEGIQGM
jgi:hypothetical protein